MRIQARAIRRCGELLDVVPRDPGGRPSAEEKTSVGDRTSFTRCALIGSLVSASTSSNVSCGTSASFCHCEDWS
ncbi:hypothetical protein [Paraburkholderia sacchari]|uniref:hypothetical protein n=1 Tax=Paraburkholderia sacchari TaxID=159450 RepID=UPI0039A551A4